MRLKQGFDGVEIHGAHGYLIDRFTYEFANKRTNKYGGDLKQRLAFMKEVTEAVIEAVGADKTLLRFSAFKGDNPRYLYVGKSRTCNWNVCKYRSKKLD